MKIEKLSKNCYRVRKRVNKETYTVMFDYKPKVQEAELALAEKIKENLGGIKGSFGLLANEYIQNRTNVVSPATIRTYNIKLRQISDDFKNMKIKNITTADVQTEINRFAENHAPKTAKTLYGFIASVLTEYRPNMLLRVKLPQAIKKDVYEPTNDDIKRILEEVKGTDYSVPFQLGILSCRRGEICAATIDDLDGDNLYIHRTMVYDDNNKWVVKETPKTETSNRILPLPPTLAEEIRKQGYIYNNHPNALNKAIHRVQKRLGIEQFKFHLLRSYFASYAHSIGICEADILKIGGWKTAICMERVYRKSIEESKRESIEKIAKGIWG